MELKKRLPSVEKPWMKLYTKEMPEVPQCSAYGFLQERLHDPDDFLLYYFTVHYTQKQFSKMVDDYARAFIGLGVKKGDVVALALPTTPENIFAFYGLNRIGAVANLVDLRSSGDILKFYLEETQCRVVLACDLFADAFKQAASELKLEHLVLISPMQSFPALVRRFLRKEKVTKTPNSMFYKEFLACGKDVSLPEDTGRGQDPAVIMHTSGTTGTPKSVIASNYAMNSMVANYFFVCDQVKRGEVFLNQVPPFLAYNIIMATHLPLCAGAALRLLPEYRPDIFAENIVKFKPNYVIAGPADWGNFLEKPPACKDFSFLHLAASGSDNMKNKIMQEVNQFLKERGCTTQIIEGYGMTEIGAAAITNLPWKTVEGSQGVPLIGNNVCIYDNESASELSYGEVGEICMSGPTLMTEYYGNPEATAETLRYHDDGILWLHSGDLGRIDENGFLFLEGRLKRIIVRHDGIKVSPFTIESMIMHHQKVANCCVIGYPDSIHGRGELPVAYIVLETEEDTEAVTDEIRKLCEEGLAENYRPYAWIVLDELPLTPNGKVDYRSLQKREINL